MEKIRIFLLNHQRKRQKTTQEEKKDKKIKFSNFTHQVPQIAFQLFPESFTVLPLA